MGLLACLLLTGCADQLTAPPSGLSKAELSAYQSAVTDRMWGFTGLDESLRPEVDVVTLDLADWVVAMEACNDEYVVDDPEMQTELAVAQYACRARYQQSAEQLGLLNTAQLDYLYDYYQDRLIPCIRTRGLHVPDVPSRAEAVDVGQFGSYPWNPYNGIVNFTREDLEDVLTWRLCPAFPPDAVFSQFWQRFDPYWRG